jgi:phosphate transport system permease protein
MALQPAMSPEPEVSLSVSAQGGSTHGQRWMGARLEPGVALRDLRPARSRLWRNRRNAGLILIATVLVLIPVVMILAYIVVKGFSYMNLDFLTHSMPFSMRAETGGFLNGLIGTAIMVGFAALVSVPLGILGAVYLVEYGKSNWLAKLIRFFSDVMTGVPSVFVGLFVYTALVVHYGFGALMGAASLAIIMMPIVVRSTEEMLKLVPTELKDASYALGAPKWKTVTKVILPSAAPGITTGVMLAIARAAGETAPLILTALGSLQLTAKLWNTPISALPLAIFTGARNPYGAGQGRAWAGALELIIIILILTILARVISSRSRLTR